MDAESRNIGWSVAEGRRAVRLMSGYDGGSCSSALSSGSVVSFIVP
jgi:hypothetical protein